MDHRHRVEAEDRQHLVAMEDHQRLVAMEDRRQVEVEGRPCQVLEAGHPYQVEVVVHPSEEEEVLKLQAAEVPFHLAVVAASLPVQVAVEPYLPVVVEVLGLQEVVEHQLQVALVACNLAAMEVHLVATEVHLSAHLELVTHQEPEEQEAARPVLRYPTKARIQIPHFQAHQFHLFSLIYNLYY